MLSTAARQASTTAHQTIIRTTTKKSWTPLRIATTTIGATSLLSATYYINSEKGLGFKRELEFWSSVAPVVWDYWWNSFESSPKVKLQQVLRGRNNLTAEEQQSSLSSSQETEQEYKKERHQLLLQLHQRNAPKLYNTMINLGGLYIKLGQVLSVTALPIPEQYREYFRTLQSSVPNHEDWVTIVKPTLERELLGVGVEKRSLEEVFERIDEVPCGAASIGQAHRATLNTPAREEVIVKVQYPNAKWQVPADIECVGQFLQLCVWFGVVDESAATLSYEEFARQFLSELDYTNEMNNLKSVYESSLDPNAPYARQRVVLPQVFEELCTDQVITMSYLPGRKFEEETKRQLSLLGIDTKKSFRTIVRESGESVTDGLEGDGVAISSSSSSSQTLALSTKQSTPKWKTKLTSLMRNVVSVDFLFTVARFTRRFALWSQSTTVKWIQLASTLSIVPVGWKTWADERQNDILQSMTLDWTEDAVHTLLDVHGYQILNQGLFNADPHPGNILVDFPTKGGVQTAPTIGLIDYGQCKQLTPTERVKIAQLILSIADKQSDEQIATNFRLLGIQTKNDSTRFLADFGRLMFGRFESKHLDHGWHRELHAEDRVLYFPKELSMVYRTALLLRGLAMSLQYNPSVGELWRGYALEAIRLHGSSSSSS